MPTKWRPYRGRRVYDFIPPCVYTCRLVLSQWAIGADFLEAMECIGINATGDTSYTSPPMFGQPGTKFLISPAEFVKFLPGVLNDIAVNLWTRRDASINSDKDMKLYPLTPVIINFIHRKNFDSSINKEKIQKKKETRSQHTETRTQTTQVIAW